MKSVMALTEVEVASLLVIAVVVATMGWFLVEPVGGTSRATTSIIAGLIALVAAVLVSLAFD